MNDFDNDLDSVTTRREEIKEKKEARKKELTKARIEILQFAKDYEMTFEEALHLIMKHDRRLKGGMSCEEVAIIMGVTTQRIQHIESKVMKKLRHPKLARPLKQYYGFVTTEDRTTS